MGCSTVSLYPIKARAIRRCGELAKLIEPARGHENGWVPTRSGEAKKAGLSSHQLKQAIRVANVPKADFERQVESERPPTITQKRCAMVAKIISHPAFAASAVAVCTCILFSACAGPGPKDKGSVPPELVPAGYTATECQVTDPGGPIKEAGPTGLPVTKGFRQPRVTCTHKTETQTETQVATCRTTGGKPLDLRDCCLNADGSAIASCTKKLIPAGE